MRALSNMRTALGRGPNAEDEVVKVENQDCKPEPLPGQILDRHGIEALDNAIEAAIDCERVLAVKMARLRRLILNLEIKRDHLVDLGEVLAERQVAA